MESVLPFWASSSLWLVAVGMLWGCTNPLIKLGSKGVTDLPKRSHPVMQFLAETFFLFTRWQYLVPFLLNMCGSVVFFWSLGSAEISLVVPITNSLTFLFTTVTSQLLGETRGVNRCTHFRFFIPLSLTFLIYRLLQLHSQAWLSS
ncbi:uncharacterized protein ACA1_002760 [Acanthamoeba castellanii str. Neff]|uniref:Membrane protein, putative n=1 Tax=Acanthamoeba castellanii (strain ATCC 30010 / Neff) TaxID=1257118 RepID=L8GGP6_ACACF|nr:uncharacterized protein ACA1_002760 [Acanthamoeba castellanii str. Neff]ELR12255.1 Membrane protein, putative [Acanthamoeba castellanii str. Neff]